MKPSILLLSALSALGLISAQQPFYYGAWKIVSAAVAPWAGPAPKPDVAEMKSLVGKIATLGPHAITGPRQLACHDPRYRVRTYPADMLFQGAFGEMQRQNSSADPAKLAASVGFRGKSWQTLETGCGNELDFHFIDPNTAAFGLNDYVYTLKKQ